MYLDHFPCEDFSELLLPGGLKLLSLVCLLSPFMPCLETYNTSLFYWVPIDPTPHLSLALSSSRAKTHLTHLHNPSA